MRKFCRLLLVAVLVAAAIPALFVATPKASASCTLLGDGLSDDGDTWVSAYQCDTSEECSDWLFDLMDGIDVDQSVELSCSVADPPVQESNPLGEPPPLDQPQPVQVENLEPACYAESCDGINPEGTRCLEDAYTLYSKEVFITSNWSPAKGSGPWGIAEMRYSPKCHANWVRYTPYTNLDDVIRFLINVGIQASNDGEGLGSYYAVPYIWRLGVENSLHGPAGSSSPAALQVTTWTSMVSADGDTCWSVEIHWREDHHAGAGETDHLGTFDTDCVS